MTAVRPLTGVSWMVHPGFRAAVAPLLAARAIEAVEWTVDAGFTRPPPPSAAAALDAFGAAGRLWGHGVGYSPLSAGRDDLAERWLGAVGAAAAERLYRGISEHFGWCTAGDQRFGAPLPLPRGRCALAVGRARLARLAAVVGVPVGVENLALAWSRADALEHGGFVAALLPPGGYVHLDLHNLWCQAVNFDVDPDVLLAGYPLERVRVVHVSGGSWQDGVRRDTHDDAVPEEVWALLRRTLPRLPACEVVFVERIAGSFAAEGAADQFAADYLRLNALRDEVAGLRASAGSDGAAGARPSEGDDGDGHGIDALAVFQRELLAALADRSADGVDPEQIAAELVARGVDSGYAAWVRGADPRMLRVSATLVRRWQVRDG